MSLNNYTPCIIFAGGKSSRMGSDKSLLPFGDFDTMTEYQIYRLQKIFPHIYISCKNADKFKSLKNYDQISFIEDIDSDEIYAPTLGFVSVFEKLKCERFFAISVDTPFIDEQIIDDLFKNDTNSVDATIAIVDGKIQPMCGIYHISLKQKFDDMIYKENHKLGLLLKSSNTNYIYFKNKQKFININFKDEYLEALKLL